MAYLEGIDVSRYQTTTPSLSGLSFAFAQSNYDVNQDAMYATHSANFRKAGLVVCAYTFGTGRSTGKAQAETMLRVAANASIFALDLEPDAVPMTKAAAQQFMDTMHAAGKTCGLYVGSGRSVPTGYHQDWNWESTRGGATPHSPWTFWQYATTNCDRDRFNGTLVDLQALAGTSGGGNVPAGGTDVSISTAGVKLTTDHQATFTAATPYLDSPGGASIGAGSKVGYIVPYIGDAAGYAAVLVLTALPYPDGVARQTIVYVVRSSATIAPAPVPPAGDVTHTVTMAVDGVVKHTEVV